MPYLDKSVVIYLDDILIYSKTAEEHAIHLQEVLDVLEQNKLFAKLSKCRFAQAKVDFLGHIVSDNGIATDPAKVAAIKEWPTPNNIRDVRSFLGLANYYRRFVAHFSAVAAPLTTLTGSLIKWLWGPEEQKAFDALKTALITAPILSAPDPAKTFIIKCDASKHGIGAVIIQGTGQDERVIAYHSRKLIPAERNYPTHEQELLSLVEALRVWRHYLLGTKVPDLNRQLG